MISVSMAGAPCEHPAEIRLHDNCDDPWLITDMRALERVTKGAFIFLESLFQREPPIGRWLHSFEGIF